MARPPVMLCLKGCALELSKLRISGIIAESIVDGPGIRFVIFTQGCFHHCKGCHNPHTFDINGGTLMDTDDLITKIKENPLLKGVTFSGGEPFLQAGALYEIAKECHSLGLDVISYTGYTFEELVAGFEEHPEWKSLLENIDILIDGPFIEEKKSLMLLFRGSSNQRILNARKSLISLSPAEMEL